jgi:hypothetical protein
MTDKSVYTAIFGTSIVYAPLLSWWKRADPVSYHQTTWLQTVIGVGYVLLYLRLLLTQENWFKVCVAFFFSSIPVIGRSLLENGTNNAKYRRNGHR